MSTQATLISAIILCSATATAQVQVLETQGQDSGESEVVLVSSDPERGSVIIEQIHDQQESVARTRRGSVAAAAWAVRPLCETPCRLRISEATRIRAGGAVQTIMPNGAPQAFEIRPWRPALWVMSLTALIGGVVTMSLSPLLLFPDQGQHEVRLDEDRIPGTIAMASSGLVLTILGIIGMAKSGRRIRPIDPNIRF